MNFRFNWDAMGVATSLACAIHCAVLPLVLTSLPVFGVNIIENMNFEFFMIFLAAGIGSYSLWHGYKKHHHSFTPLLIFLAGIGFLFAKQAWHHFEYWLLPIAVILIISAHLMNYRACRVHDHAHKEDCDH
ncbi:MAG: MerC domain-containing protein [Chitinophagaceae bacterium]|nr:MAG: MerC domain-containing protein [Chitinophagaceae bacterium]